jgi:Ala-tRNA(Pro) deacylase
MRLGLATENEIAKLFHDREFGAVLRAGAAYGLAVIVDESVINLPDVYLEGGDHATLVHLTGDAFRRLMKDARRSRFSDHAPRVTCAELLRPVPITHTWLLRQME